MIHALTIRTQQRAVAHRRGACHQGWDEGANSMKVGSKHTLYIPAALVHGVRDASVDIPPNADLVSMWGCWPSSELHQVRA